MPKEGPVPRQPAGEPARHNGDDAKRRLEVALRSGHMGTYSWEPISGLGIYDEPLLELYGFQPGEFGGELGEPQALGCTRRTSRRELIPKPSRSAMDEGRAAFDREIPRDSFPP